MSANSRAGLKGKSEIGWWRASAAFAQISYVALKKLDARMRAEMERCQREGTPRPESSAVRAHTFSEVYAMSASPPKADIAEVVAHVRFVPNADSCIAATNAKSRTGVA